jgi:hypothetical protein
MGKKTQRRKGAKAQRKPGIGFSSLRPCVFAPLRSSSSSSEGAKY